MWIEFDGSLFCTKRFFSRCSCFPLSLQKLFALLCFDLFDLIISAPVLITTIHLNNLSSFPFLSKLTMIIIRLWCLDAFHVNQSNHLHLSFWTLRHLQSSLTSSGKTPLAQLKILLLTFFLHSITAESAFVFSLWSSSFPLPFWSPSHCYSYCTY